MAAHLRGNGVSDEQIIEMNFESYEFLKMTADELYRYVKERVLPDRRIYLFFDELQRMDGWENAVNSFCVDFDCDIYITGSNAYLLSSEYSTYLSGRCVEIKMLPLSFAEFVDFYGFTIKTVKSALGGQKKKRSIKMVRNTNCVRFLTRTCVLAVCRYCRRRHGTG